MKKLLSSTKGKLEVKDNSYENPCHSIGTYWKAITPKKKKKIFYIHKLIYWKQYINKNKENETKKLQSLSILHKIKKNKNKALYFAAHSL